MLNSTWVEQLFAKLASDQPQQFFEYVSDTVKWEVTGTHPLAGVYYSKQAFIEGTIAKLNAVLSTPLKLKYLSSICGENTAAVELVANSTTKAGAPFNNRYCWVCEFEGNKIVAVRAYLDSALVANTIDQ
ncbi:nuclear transport factor 2 family protein [Agarivorans aestuarii]|uniref:Nuclear transport factor 2 family protein n=1 Tax=Agarivorans aestuarii TaxID=1563703 RepID=A0ABU7G578_9ALTE|nr:nuclear transport factor 2 family protein [Agarivorans aestuarii]MEE1674381.1 nuclear transport factor 2 family protein [Agarivorans aestuarii]